MDVRHNGPEAGAAEPPDKGPNTVQAVVACACAATSDHTVLLRATLEAIDDCSARARIDEVLAPAHTDLVRGDIVGGARSAIGGCGHGLDLVVGDAVLVVYTRGMQDGDSCVEYAQCAAKSCAEAPTPASDGGADCSAQCAAETRAACAAHADEARLGGQLVVARDGDNVVFGYEPNDAVISLPKSEIDRLLDPATCNAWFMQHATGGPSAGEAPSCTP